MFNVDLMFIFFMFWSPSCFLVKVEFSSLFKELVNLLRRKPPYALFIRKNKIMNSEFIFTTIFAY